MWQVSASLCIHGQKKGRMKMTVKPVAGSILRVDLRAIGSHTGIYLGRDRRTGKDFIAELTNVDGEAMILQGNADWFRNASEYRSGGDIEVACSNQFGVLKPLSSRTFANRAKKRYMEDCGEYSLSRNNCHQFTYSCITGDAEPPPFQLTVRRIENALKQYFGIDHIEWVSTGKYLK